MYSRCTTFWLRNCSTWSRCQFQQQRFNFLIQNTFTRARSGGGGGQLKLSDRQRLSVSAVGKLNRKDIIQSPPLASKDKPVEFPGLLKPTIFVVAFSVTSFSVAAIWQFENMRYRARELIRSPKRWVFGKIEPSDLWSTDVFNDSFQVKRGSLRNSVNQIWNSTSEANKVFACILAANVTIFTAWKFPRFQSFLTRYFISNSANKKVCLPMFFSMFSHYSTLHLAANMFVLQSFISNAMSSLGKEQFLAVYFSAGLFASLASLAYRVLLKEATMSLGASGAIMGLISYTCVKYPDTLLSIVFLPFFVFKAGSGIKAIIGFDFLCLLLKFKVFDHAAHLGGALFGIFWCTYGEKYIWQRRSVILEWWRQIKR